MNVTFEQVEGEWVAVPDGPRIDAINTLNFKETMRGHINGCSEDIILDLQKVTFIDSSGLGAVVALGKLMGSNRQLSMANLHPTVAKVFHLTQATKTFPILKQWPEAEAKSA